MKALTQSCFPGLVRPTPKIIQFGEGNFLRAFFDWQIDIINETLGEDWGVTVVRPIAGGVPFSLNDQDGLYHAVTRGVDKDGKPTVDMRLVKSVLGEISAYDDYAGYLALAHNPEYRVIVSNTTEAGIVFDEKCKFDDKPPATFPAKLTRLLWERFTACKGDVAQGFQIFPCELIDDNAGNLKRCVEQYIAAWKLDAAFADWVAKAVSFYNTLVDRIVPGFPREEADALYAELGVTDRFLVAAERFYLFVIERKPGQPALLIPFEKAGLEVIVTEDIKPYKERKVAILNGGHTSLAPLALLSGVETVGDALNDPALRGFLAGLFKEEIMPYISLPPKESEAFAAEVLRRFENPFIRHLWYDISLNSIAKFKARVLPRMLACHAKTGKAPRHMSLALAAWLLFYLGKHPHAAKFPPRDSDDVLQTVGKLAAIADPAAQVDAFLLEKSFWDDAFSSRELRAGVLAAYKELLAVGGNPAALLKVPA